MPPQMDASSITAINGSIDGSSGRARPIEPELESLRIALFMEDNETYIVYLRASEHTTETEAVAVAEAEKTSEEKMEAKIKAIIDDAFGSAKEQQAGAGAK